MMHLSRGAAMFRWAQACSTRGPAARPACRRRTATSAPRMFSTLQSISVTAADEAVTVTIESAGGSYSASAECGRAASGRGAAEAERAGPILGQVLQGMEVTDQSSIDDELEEMRGAELAEIDGNVTASLTAATSMAVCKAGAAASGLPLYHHIAQIAQRPTDQFVMPIPFMAVLSGGKRSENILPVQDILACPNTALTFAEGHELVSELLAVLGNTLHDIEGMEPEETDVGSWAPQEEDITASVKLAYEAIQDAGIDGRLTLGMHVAPSSGLFTGDEKYDLYDLNYKDPERPDESRADSLCYLYQKLSERFPLVSFFGTFDYRDFENHSRLTNLIDIQNIATELVHPLDRTESGWREPEDRLQQAARDVACQGILLTLGRPGGCLTLSAAVDIADRAEDLVMVNVVDATDMRCQEFNAHMAVGLRGGQVLTAAPTQGAGSTLLGIEQELGAQSIYAAQVGQQ